MIVKINELCVEVIFFFFGYDRDQKKIDIVLSILDFDVY